MFFYSLKRNIMDLNIIILTWFFLVLLLISILIILFVYRIKKEISLEIKKSVEPKFLEIAISPNSNKIISLAIDIWRLEDKINNISELSNENKEKLNVSINRIKKFINDQNIKIKWFTWEKYSEEINFYELKATEETDDKSKNNIIKDTIEPAVFVDWNLIKTAKIIIYKLNS